MKFFGFSNDLGFRAKAVEMCFAYQTGYASNNTQLNGFSTKTNINLIALGTNICAPHSPMWNIEWLKDQNN